MRWPSSSILSTNSCCILMFLGESFLGLQRIGLVDPVSISCTTASVRPVIGGPRGRKRVYMFSKQIGCARWSLVSSLAASSTSSKCGGSLHSPALRSVSRVPICCMSILDIPLFTCSLGAHVSTTDRKHGL